jgi:XapX domain-containing protein
MFKTFLVSGFLGFMFKWLSLDIPCPPTVQGILGIIGLFVGYKLGSLL